MVNSKKLYERRDVVNKSCFLLTVAVVALSGQGFVLGETKKASGNKIVLPEVERPNIVFFIADDVSQEDFGCYGHPKMKTPSTDALAAGGMRFDNAYLTTSSCSPSRCSIITGRYPHNTGAPELHTKLPESQIRFPEILRANGYYTVLAGKNHMFSSNKSDRAFDKITKGGGPGGELDWVEHVQDRPREKPFFFWFASNDAHRGWKESKEAPVYRPQDVVVPPYLVDAEATREDLASYAHEVSRFDHFVGLVTAELKKQGVLSQTMIVVASDNGRPFPRCKTRLYDSGIKTPWVVHYPDLIKRPSVSKSLVSVIDLSATCLELAGVEKPACIQGQSFVPVMKDPQVRVRELVFAEHNWHVFKNHERMVRFNDYVYIKNNYPNQINLCVESSHATPAGKDLWEAHAAGATTAEQQQVFANPCPTEELYRLSNDPNQFINLASNPEHSEALVNARKQLAKWTEQTGDTIPDNPTPHRYSPPRIENGKIIPGGDYKNSKPHAEMPGAARNAMSLNHPGPLQLKD
ncbi:sulfatase family protein [Neorhodopirellula lusitana]|uniref:sulfatase family protein n=1 Tax=Neorhodopirellula lusitana TaxID=445327 RepID=UPI00384C1C16